MPSSVLGESLHCAGAHICTLAYQGLLESKPEDVGDLDHYRKFPVLQGNTNTGVHWGDCYCVIGASLSELHTSGTALRKCVCNVHAFLLAAIYRKF